eukprot:TRINITY_DN23803_c0_g1_i10.p1 TRINITY_DN23803_c0_g1~~TRINITY_DN23803_c0_g1_i10.p1  ORF type:complete len:172 (+),score=36.66 TRINITY_DN23803_c0_g1_i10:218-733(+)
MWWLSCHLHRFHVSTCKKEDGDDVSDIEVDKTQRRCHGRGAPHCNLFSNLLMQCGDVESNPGPPKRDSTRQAGSRKLSLDRDSTQSGRQQSLSEFVKEPSMSDLMAKLDCLNNKFDNKFDELKEDLKEIKESYTSLKEEVEDLQSEVSSLRQSNEELSETNRNLKQRMDLV